MSDREPEERPKDWMEIWYETGEITWQKPLPPEAEQRIEDLWRKPAEEQDGEVDGDQG
ncbi:hypothetical protein [Streptomyces sp. NPDC047990]|uniref:hypothetical protein n=1 Tax=Streptomyces sp. NPDC047990 TaxID=3365496 RepID=UPI003715D836